MCRSEDRDIENACFSKYRKVPGLNVQWVALFNGMIGAVHVEAMSQNDMRSIQTWGLELALSNIPKLCDQSRRVALFGDKGYKLNGYKHVRTEGELFGDDVVDDYIKIENSLMSDIRRIEENCFADIKNVWRRVASSDNKKVLVGDIGVGWNDPVLFSRQEVVVAAFLHNCHSLVRQNRMATKFNYIRSGVFHVDDRKSLPTVEEYMDNMQHY